METSDFSKRVGNATSWSAATELMAKLVSPLSSMVLARLLTPEAFGIIATINLIISFADMFTDAGFQKYLIQHEFFSKNEEHDNATVAFWSNLAISFFLWLIIGIFRDPLADLVGNPGYGHVLVIACISLPLTSFSSIQRALYQRDFDFKTLFLVRIIGICIPLFVTVPLAILTRNFWALIIGTIIKNLSDAIVMTIKSPWKPRCFFSFRILTEMFSFSAWTLLEQISIWLSNYIGTLIVGRYLTIYYAGLYKTSMTTVNQFTTLITASTAPVLFSSLSRLQDDNTEFQAMFYKFQRLIASISVPLSVGMYMYRELMVKILLGSQWTEATEFIGIYALTGSVVIVGQYCSEVYRAKGRPRLSTVVQCLFLCVSIPMLLYGAKAGFNTLAVTQNVSRISLIIIHLFFMGLFFGFSPVNLAVNLLPCFAASGVMFLCGTLLQRVSGNIMWQFVSIALCCFVYYAALSFSKQYREEIVMRFMEKIKTLKRRLEKT